MLITPVQPHNSLNNVVTLKQRHSEDSHITRSSKVQPLKPSSIKAQNIQSPREGSPKKTKDQENNEKKAAQAAQDVKTQGRDQIRLKQTPADVLKEYKQINKDKDILTAEIKNMKVYLADIRSKLDQSLTVLNRNTTLFAIKAGIAAPKSGRAKKTGQKTRKKRVKKSGTARESFFTKELLQLAE